MRVQPLLYVLKTQAISADALANLWEHQENTSEVKRGDYIYKELSKDQWTEVIEKARNAENSGLHLFLLRSLANEQTVSAGSLAAYKGEVMNDLLDRRLGSSSIGTISTWVRQVTGDQRDTFYQWNEAQGNWMIGWSQAQSLRAALK